MPIGNASANSSARQQQARISLFQSNIVGL
jgi:hypothetical protein